MLVVPYRNTEIRRYQETSKFRCFLGTKDTLALHMVPNQLEFPAMKFQANILDSNPNKYKLLVQGSLSWYHLTETVVLTTITLPK